MASLCFVKPEHSPKTAFIDSPPPISYFQCVKNAALETSKPLFETLLNEAIVAWKPRRLERGECQTSGGSPCTLCSAYRISYEDEIKIKNEILKQYWSLLNLFPSLEPLVPSPLGRSYRTVTKRKVFSRGIKIQLGLIDASGTNPIPVERCMIEPEGHAAIYATIQGFIERKEQNETAKVLQYVIVKGNYREFTVILNMTSFDPMVRHFANNLSKHLTGKVAAVTGIFAFVEEKSSRYYMHQGSNNRQPKLMRIFGKRDISQTVGQRRFRFSPLSFSQTNLSIAERFASTAIGMMQCSGNDQLLDLYCGYGLFSLGAASQVRSVTGVDLSQEAINDALGNAEALKVKNSRFIRADVDEESLERLLSSRSKFTKVILDPPRNGTKPNVIELIAAREISRALHIFCNIDLMPQELERWNSAGYSVVRAVPFDMFPGTREVEVMVVLERNR